MPYRHKNWLYNEYIINKNSVRSIAINCGVSTYKIELFLNKYDIPRRSRSEAAYLLHKNDPIILSEAAKEFILGNVLGDGSLVIHKNTKNIWSSAYGHSSKYYGFLKYIKSEIERFGILSNGAISTNMHKINKATYHTYFSRSYSELLKLRNYIYKDNNKTIPEDLVLTPTICLHWYLGDGSLTKPKDGNPYCRISTDSFSEESLNIAINKFNDLGMYVSRRPSDNSLRFIKSSSKKFIDYISPCPEGIKEYYNYKFAI